MSDLPGEAVTAGLQAMRKHSREAEDHDDFISECCVAAAFAAAAPHIDAAARASERERCVALMRAEAAEIRADTTPLSQTIALVLDDVADACAEVMQGVPDE